MTFEDKLKKRIDNKLNLLVKNPYGNSSDKTKKPFFTKKKIPLFSVLGTVLTAVLVGVIILVWYVTPSFSSLKLDKYKVNLSDAESIGIVPLEENNNKSLLVKKNKNTGKLEPVNFLKKKTDNKQNKAYTYENSRVIAKNLDSYDELAAEQDKLGWVIRNYLVLEDGYTLVQFVPKPSSFKRTYEASQGYGYYFVSHTVYYNHIPVRPGDGAGFEWADFTTMREDDFNINHYYNGRYLLFDADVYTWGRAAKSYIIDNETGYIYTTEFLNGDESITREGGGRAKLYFYNNMLLYKEGHYFADSNPNPGIGIPDMDEHTYDNASYQVRFETNGDNLEVKLSKDLPTSTDFFKDRYGQYFAPVVVKEGIDYEKKVKIMSKSEWDAHFVTTDNRMLVIKNQKLYEYVDDFELIEVPDDVTYKCAGYYSDYSFITNKYIFNLSKDYIVDINNYGREVIINHGNVNDHTDWQEEKSLEGVTKINALMVLEKDYYLYSDNHTLKCIKNPFNLYKAFKETHPDVDIPLLYADSREEGFLEERNEEYHQLLNDNSVTLDDVVSWKFKNCDNDNSYYSDGHSIIPVDEELLIYQWTMDGNKPYVVQINDSGEIEFIEVEDYTPKQYEFVLTPINI